MARPTEDDPEEAGLPPAQTEEEENEDLTADYALLFTNKSRDPANLLAAGASLPQPAQLALQFQVPRDTRDAALHISLESLRIILGEERSGLAKNLVRCSWLDGEGEAVVDIPRGNHLKTVGYQLSAQTRLLPEEMLYLLEQGAATCLRGGVPLSLQQAYAIMLGGSDHSNKKMPATEEFLVYSYLKRLGYVVRRCREFRKGKVVSHGWIDWTRGHFNGRSQKYGPRVQGRVLIGLP